MAATATATTTRQDAARRMAAALIGTKNKPAGLVAIVANAKEARAYHELKPYPLYAFRNWKTEDRGPLPRCMTTAKRIVRRGARFLFGKGIEIKVAGNEPLEELLVKTWSDNKMASRAVAMAENAAIESGVALKFSWDPDAKPQVRIDTLSIVDQVRFWYDPHDRRRVLLARVQYRYYDPVLGKWFWYREEWTEAEEVHYAPLQDENLSAGDPDLADGWTISTRATNPFGLIPIAHIQNLDVDQQFGTGDMWDLFRIVDDANLAWWQMKRSNQFDSELNPYFVDLNLDDEDLDKPAVPGQPIAVESVAEKKGTVVFPPGGNSLRPALMEYAKELRKQIEDAAGSVTVDQAEFTNKGNLTAAVLEQLYQTQLEMTAEKQKSYGQNGIEPFLESLAIGLQRIGLQMGIDETNEESYEVTIDWPAAFDLSEEEKTQIVGRMQEEEVAGYTTRERAIDRVAQMDNVRDIGALKDELSRLPQQPVASPTETEIL